MENILSENFKENYLPDMTTNNSKKYYAVLLFETALNLGLPDAKPGQWVHLKTLPFGTNGSDALNYYVNTPNPASQLISAESEELLQKEINKMINNYKNEKWLDKNLYPYL